MEPVETEKKILDFIKGNAKVFIYIIISFAIISLSYFWFLNKSNNKKIQVSDDYIKAKILLDNGKNKEAEKILSNLIMNNDSIYSSLSLFLIIEKEVISDKEVILNYFDLILSGNSLKKESILEGNFVSIFLGFWRRNGAQALPGNRRKSRKVEKMTFWTRFASFQRP